MLPCLDNSKENIEIAPKKHLESDHLHSSHKQTGIWEHLLRLDQQTTHQEAADHSELGSQNLSQPPMPPTHLT